MKNFINKIIIVVLFSYNLSAYCNCSPQVAYNFSVATKTILKTYSPIFSKIKKLTKSIDDYFKKEKKENKRLDNVFKIEEKKYLYLYNINKQLSQQNNLILLQIKSFK
ncbi:hypothetical protein [Caminibacter mediatlanticus]|uniref:Borrelia virulent strain associated lipoprotein n=1 Tax=Caminibacter mediatlanticus TB-2 TaxID=391592 RepID=A0AAI9F1U3_9BACT|nr:hypothetical protein [Caminibacter mediatlanticus]EDM22911.1 hypothetical protein CMTB2_05467 [Caminibacter mediatlanticus TB-2]